ncbi:MAG: class I adenylate-forming enzyme family protein [Streptosporangiaceae bacterium]
MISPIPDGRAPDMPGSTAPDRDLIEVVRDACRADPEVPALIFEDGVSVSRRRLWAETESFAGYLSSRIGPGDRVAVMMPNRAEFMITWLAVAACRGILVALNPAARSYDAGHVLRDSAARVAVVDAAYAELFFELQPDCPELTEIIVAADGEPGGLSDYAGPGLPERPDEARGDLTNIFYTSGTTGPPKGCAVGHDYWIRFADLMAEQFSFTGADRMICCLQFFYNDPPWMLLLALSAGTSMVAMRRFSVSRYWQVVREYDVTVLFGIASTASLLLKAPANDDDRRHKVRLSIQVGIPAPLHQDLVDRWGVPWVEAYGLTETGVIVSMPVEQAEEMIGSGSIGVPCPGADVRVVGPDGTDCGDDQPGEIVVRAPGLFRGYLNRAEATAETYRGGWLHTGDLGRRDAAGYLYFVGRSKDVIRRAGENIAAAEVETVLRSHPGVLEVAAVPVPDEVRGEEVKVHILLGNGHCPSSVPPAELIDFCAGMLARYKVPRYVEYRAEDFDRTPSMRVKKENLDRSADPSRVWDRSAELSW